MPFRHSGKEGLASDFFTLTDWAVHIVTESDLRQTAVDEYFASGHKAAFIGGQEQGHRRRFVRVANTLKWCLTGKTGQKSFLHPRSRQSIEQPWRRGSPRREHIDPDTGTLQV